MPTYTHQPMRRVEDEPLITGRGTFVDDIALPDLLHASAVRSPHAHARLLSTDTAAAEAMPGVVGVYTAASLADCVRTIPVVPRQGGDYGTLPEHPVLAQEAVYYVGQPVAVVVAEQRGQAVDAAEYIDVDYEPLPALTDPRQALEPGQSVLHAEMESNLAMRVRNGRGRMADVRPLADRVLHGAFESPRVSALPLEGRGIVASYSEADDRLTVWASTQVPYRIRMHLAEVLLQPPQSIRVLAPDVGGGFGQKVEMWAEYVAVSWLAMHLGRPVKWIEGRMENLLAYHGRGFSAEVEAAVNRDGKILGMRFDMIGDLGAYVMAFTSAPPVNATKRVAGPYDIAVLEIECLGVITNKPSTGPYRGAGAPEGTFFMECMIDHIARELELDPAVVRKRNLVPASALPYTTGTGQHYDSGDFNAAFDQALALADYDGWRRQQRDRSESSPLLGIGIATVVKGSGGVGPSRTSHARIDVQPSGEVEVYTEVSPHGQGTETTFAQIAADVLGMPPHHIRVRHSDTDQLPDGQGTYASRGLTVGGSAVYVVLQEARQALVQLASRMLECAPEDVVLQEGLAYNRHYPQQPLDLPQIVAFAQQDESDPNRVGDGLSFPIAYTLADNPYAFGAHVAVVAIDRDTGELTCLRYVAVHDAGPLINPLLSRGQIHGGIVQGVGQALTEFMAYTDYRPAAQRQLDGLRRAACRDVSGDDRGNHRDARDHNPHGHQRHWRAAHGGGACGHGQRSTRCPGSGGCSGDRHAVHG